MSLSTNYFILVDLSNYFLESLNAFFTTFMIRKIFYIHNQQKTSEIMLVKVRSSSFCSLKIVLL